MNLPSSPLGALPAQAEPWATGPMVWTSASAADLHPREARPMSRMPFARADAPVPADTQRTSQSEAGPQPLKPEPEPDDALMEMKLEAVRMEAIRDARRLFEVQLEQRLTEERGRLDRLRIEFARDRQRYFASAESQVVRLALALARRVLHREAASDGMHLRATVKAALARVQDGSETILRTSEDEAAAWAAMFEGHSGSRSTSQVQVVGDERMTPGEIVLETRIGRVELGIAAQMDEMELRFAELLQTEPEEEAGGG